MTEKKEKFAIRFGLGGVKAVGFAVMENAVKERVDNGDFKDVYDFTSRLDPRSINKKSIEALAKAGAFDVLNDNRKQMAESFEILSNYANQKHEEATSNQMQLFGSISNSKPALAKTTSWLKAERLQKEFEAFGFFLNEHPVDDYLDKLRKRGVIFSDKIERGELEDSSLVKMAGVVAGSKHRSSAKGRFAYLTVSDPFGMFEGMIFDEGIITNARDLLVDGSAIALECLVRKDDGGLRILVRSVKKLDDFVEETKAAAKDFEDIKKQPARRKWNKDKKPGDSGPSVAVKEIPVKNSVEKITISLEGREAIFNLKAFLASNLAPFSASPVKTTKVFLQAADKIVEIGNNYCLDENDLIRLKKIKGVSLLG